MKIKFKSLSRNALGKYRPCSVADLPDAEAMEFLNKGYADPVKESAATETAALPVEAMTEVAAAAPATPPAAVQLPAIGAGKKKKKKRK
jgi:hypothetical protein